jgi:hypothetical protein
MVISNEHKSYSMTNVKRSLVCRWVALFTSVDKCYISRDVFVILMLFNLYNFITKMWGYQQNKTIRIKYSYKYRHHCTRYHIAWLTILQWCQRYKRNKILFFPIVIVIFIFTFFYCSHRLNVFSLALLKYIILKLVWKINTFVSNHFHSVKILLFSAARSRDF